MTLPRQQAFQQLRPPCVALSSVALRFKGHQAPVKDVLHALQALCSTLTLLGEQNALDEKLAEYAFFPLTHVFNDAQRLSSSCLEVAIKCVIVLVTRGWRHHLAIDLAKQLLILLTLVGFPDSAKGQQQQQQQQTPEEVKLAALQCIDAIIVQLSGRPDSHALFDEIGMKNILDQLVYVILDAIKESESEQIQITAADALSSVLAVVPNRVMLASVLPSTASTLTKVLRKSPTARRTRKVLVSYLRVLNLILHSVLADTVVYPLQDDPPGDALGTSGDQKAALGASWLKATASQVKLILLQVCKLRSHENPDVRIALADLCFMVARDCSSSLSDSTSVVVETLLYIGSVEETPVSLDLEQLAISDSRIADVIHSNFDRSCQSLPRLFASNDEQPKIRIIGELTTSVKVLDQIHFTKTGVLNRLTSSLLAAFGTVVSTDTKQQPKQSDQGLSIVPLVDTSELTTTYSFPQLTINHPLEKDVLSKVQILLSVCSSHGLSDQLARILIDRIEGQVPEDQVTAIWLALTCLRLNRNEGLDLDDILDIEKDEGDSQNSRSYLISDLYASALPFLQDEYSDGTLDSRLKALAIECTVLQAEQLEVSYRPELVDTLYPILALLGSQDQMLRNHAIIGLNLLAQACGYLTASDMLVDNVDYLINAVALKLNSFDVSPQAPQVVLMMLRLCGARIVPYLDDTIASIFSALDNFHGYPRLVELLFQVLKGVVDESKKQPELAITSDWTARDVATTRRPLLQINDIVENLQKRKSRKRRYDEGVDVVHAPHRPWKEKLEEGPSSELNDGSQENAPEEMEGSDSRPKDDDPLKRLSKEHRLLLDIAKSTSPHMSSPSPQVRHLTLELLEEVAPLLARDENTFLPMVNAIWPSVVARLLNVSDNADDAEASYNICAAAHTVTVLCEGAGSFMSTRIDDVFPKIRRLFDNVTTSATASRANKSRTVTGVRSEPGPISATKLRTSKSQILAALLKLLVAILNHVQITDDVGDDIVAMLAPFSVQQEGQEQGSELRRALEAYNADALWIWELENHSPSDTPEIQVRSKQQLSI